MVFTRLEIELQIAGFRLAAVDGVDIRHSSHELAVKTIKNAGDKMTLLVHSLNTASADQTPVDFVKKLPPPITPSKTPQPEIIQVMRCDFSFAF